METTETLFIIGNGFDLSMGLKTTYKNFFESGEISELERLYFQNFIRDSNSKRINLFLAYLFESKIKNDPNWNYIEEKISNFFYFVKDHRNTINYILSQYKEPRETFHRLFQITTKEYNLPPENLNDILFKELKNFEKIFGEYIINEEKKILEFNSNNNYVLRADKKTVEKIQEIILYDIDFSATNILSVINFNYTNFIDFCIKKRDNFKLNDINIHGDVEEPIFGIDSKYNNDLNLIKFTKTSRLLGNWTIHDQWKLPEPKHLKNINFFGHSLAKADYSYFQSIFDYYNIYDSHIYLNFFYNENYDKEGLHQHTNVMNLITEYGNTLDNKDKGKNLLHKMLLENRIHLIGLDV